MGKFSGILFDLDGTLVDSANDLLAALNHTLATHHQAPIDVATIRPLISFGVTNMLLHALPTTPDEATLQNLRHIFLKYYAEHTCSHSQLFPDILTVLDHLDSKQLPWGIVTDKFSQFTDSLLKSLSLNTRTHCVVCGDTINKRKPDPAPVEYACALLDIAPHHTLFVGDHERDIFAGKGAGTKTALVKYGYGEPSPSLIADYYLTSPLDLLAIITQ